ncbi:hypothetical protein KUTeg_016791 [Tegillarca granosa]|uniref:Uncharacterized protein n=1 Tax=Tegillarca granosa TaxID=220873 RepID=A0ABQ9ELY8_TEGGR|nr:hypothetical protein KUTeg_016791 [Tegillarca granosa]
MDDPPIYTEHRTYEDPEKLHKPKWLGQDRLYRWNMLRIQLNDKMCKTVLSKLKTTEDIISCLKIDSKISQEFVNNPGIENAGSALQKKYGHLLLTNDFYFLFGMPRVAKIFGNAYKNVEFEGGFTTKEEYENSIHEKESRNIDFSEFGMSFKNVEPNRIPADCDERGLAASRRERDEIAASRRERDEIAASRRGRDDIAASRRYRDDIAASRGERDDIAASRRDRDDISTSRRERDDIAASSRERNKLAASRNDRNWLAASRKQDELGISYRNSTYDYPDVNYRMSRRDKSDDNRRENFGEFGASNRRPESSEYQLVIRREHDESNELGLRKSRRRFDSGVESALWHLDKTLDEHA